MNPDKRDGLLSNLEINKRVMQAAHAEEKREWENEDEADFRYRNGMEDLSQLTEQVTHTVFVDSSFRDTEAYPEPEQYTMTFDEPFRNVVNVNMSSAEVPKSDYNVNSSNNTLRIYVIDYIYQQTADTNGTQLDANDTHDVSSVQLDLGQYHHVCATRNYQVPHT